MTRVLFLEFLVLAIFSRWQAVLSVLIEIKPIQFNGLVTTDVNISCLPSSVEKHARSVVVIQIVRGEQNVVGVHRGSGLVYGTDFTWILEAEGQVDSVVGKSYLRLTMRNLIDVNSGIYTCLLYYIDEMGFMVEERDDDHLVVEDQDVKSYLKYLIQEKFTLEDLVKDQALKLKEQEEQLKGLKIELQDKEKNNVQRMTVLEDLTQKQNENIQDLLNKDRHLSAFNAGYGRSDALRDGDLVIFDNEVMNQGEGYDKTTGLFTAPTKGIYSFQVTVLPLHGGIYLRLDIQVNKISMAKTLLYDDKSQDQSSTTCVVKLDPGDVVRVVADHVIPSGSVMHPYPYSLFTGFLVKAL